jgi:3-deoxy-7-phosphoheptulonate synthase
VILRGSAAGPNYGADAVARVVQSLRAAGLAERVMIDCSHGNSGKDPNRQPAVAREIAAQLAGGSSSIGGVMIESHLVGGRQDARQPKVYGQSITDGCLAWDATVPVLDELAASVRARRAVARERAAG